MINKRILRFAFLLVSFACFICIAYRIDGGEKHRFSMYFMNDSEYGRIIEERKETKRDFIREISFDGQQLVRDVNTETFYYSINEGSRHAYNPVVKLKLHDGKARLAVRKNNITNELIKNNETIELILYTDKVYRKYFLKVTLLPIMQINCSNTESELDVPMTLRLYDNRENMLSRVSASEGRIHIRGGTSINYPKKGYKLSLDNPAKLSFLGMRNDDDWILYAAYNDQERVRNVFSTKLWKDGCASNNDFGLDNGIEYRFIELFLNGSYHGLYALGYPVDGLVLDLTDKEYIYKKKYWDWEAAEDFSKTGAMAGYELVSRRENNISAWQPLRSYYKLIYETDKSNDTELLNSIDIGNSIDIYIFLNLIQGADHVDKRSIHNVYITAKRLKDRYVMLYTPWDMDQTWGNVWESGLQNQCEVYGAEPEDDYVLKSGVIAELVNRNNDIIIKAVSERYRVLRRGAWSDEAVCALIDDYERDIYYSGAYLRDMERWESATCQNPETGLDKFREYVLERFKHMDACYQ